MSILNYIPSEALILLHLSLALWAIYHNLLYKRDTRSALGWIMICILVPYGGPIGYYFFGINRIHKRAKGIKRGFMSVDYEIGSNSPAPIKKQSRPIETVGDTVMGSPIVLRNHLRLLHNGDETYPAMLAAIQKAKHSVCLTTYIFQIDTVGQQFIDALEQASKRGVEVQVIVDGIGELYSWPHSSKILRKLGIRVARFLPPKLFPPSIYINLRNHRKLLLVDSTQGFIGGMNIGDRNTATPTSARAITDMHFEVSGPIASNLQHLFHIDWQYATGEKPPALEELEHASSLTDMGCRLIPDGPDEYLGSLSLILHSVISAASRSILIMTPYFLPSRELLSTIQSAALRGVDVKILLPEKNNLFYMHWANRNSLAELLKWGIDISYQPAPFCHSKMICIDSDYCLIGSANLDSRSLRLNFELGLEVISEQLNSELSTHFMTVFSQSSPLDISEIQNRSIPVRLRDSAVALLSPYL